MSRLRAFFLCIAAPLVLVFRRLAYVGLLAAGFESNHIAGLCAPCRVRTGFRLMRLADEIVVAQHSLTASSDEVGAAPPIRTPAVWPLR